MKTCRVKPSKESCKMCLEMQMAYNKVEDCLLCDLMINNTYELYDIIPGILNTYAIIINAGSPIRVSIDRIYDIKEY